MATLKLIENPTKRVANARRRKTTTRRKRRNTTTSTRATVRNTAVTASAPLVANARKRRRRRRNPSVVTARSVENAPRRRRRRRRNGGILSRKNGIFGDSKETVRSVVALLAGLGVTKVQSSILSPSVARLLASVGMQGFAKPVTEAALAVTVNKWVAEQLGTRNDGKFVMIGGLAMAAMGLIEQLLPAASPYNPFASTNLNPVVINQPVLDSGTVKALTNAAAKEVSAKVSGALDAMSSANYATTSPYNTQSGMMRRGIRFTY